MQSSLFSVGTTINVLLHCTSEPVFRLHLDARSEFHLLWGAMGLFLRKKHELLLEGLEPGMTAAGITKSPAGRLTFWVN